MKGLRISFVPEGATSALSRLAERLETEMISDSEVPWMDALEPPWLSNFSRFLGPLFPEMLQRTWLLCESDAPLLTRPFADFYDMEKPVEALEELERLELASGDRWRVVRGEYMVRVANHIDEDDLKFMGIPSKDESSFLSSCERNMTAIEIERIAEKFCDMVFCSYEGIWGVFLKDIKLLARVFLHCSEYFTVLEIEDGVSFNGDWLRCCRASCPAFPILLKGEEGTGQGGGAPAA